MNEIDSPALADPALASVLAPAARKSPIEDIIDAIKRKLGQAANSKFAQGAGDFGKSFGENLVRGSVDLLPNIGDARYAAQAAGQMRGRSQAEAGLSGALVHGPLAAEGVRRADDARLNAAALKMLGLQLRGTGLDVEAAAKPGGAGGEIVNPVTQKKTTVAAQPTAIAKQEAFARALTGQVGERTKAEEAAKAPFEKGKAAAAADQKARELAVTDAEKARSQAIKEYDAAVKVNKTNASAQAKAIARHMSDLRLNASLKKAGRAPVSKFYDSLPADSVLRIAIDNAVAAAAAKRGLTK